MKIEQFIDTVLIHDIGEMVKVPCLHYLSFGVMMAGVELLGACKDSLSFEKENESTNRFNCGVRDCLGKVDSRYRNHLAEGSPHYFYSGVRCGMLHILKPGDGIVFSSRSSFASKDDAIKAGIEHFGLLQGNTLILVVEDLYVDFVSACEFLKLDLPRLRQDPSKKKKLDSDFISITSFPVSSQ